MNLTDPAKETLLDELVAERERAVTGESGLEEIVAIVRCAKARRSQQRRRCAVGGAVACFMVLMMIGVENFHASRQATARQPASPPLSAQSADALPQTADASPVERLNDEGLLDLLDTTPSALVEWPDGRRALLLVVGEAKPAPR